MTSIVLTQYGGKIVGPIAKLIGYIIEFLYNSMANLFGIENIGLSIILFTLVVYILMFPLTYKQQKFAKLQVKMGPEIKAIQKKYEGKKDQNSRVAMQEEVQGIYDKYGVSQAGSCLPLLIQFPILLAVYRVVYNVPAYVSTIKNSFAPVVEGIMDTAGYKDILAKVVEDVNLKSVSLNLDGTKNEAANSIIDVLYKFTGKGWTALTEQFPSLTDEIKQLQDTAHTFNSFLGLDVSYSPLETIRLAFSDGKYVILVIAILIPIISGLTQWLNLKLSSSAQSTAMDDNPMAKQMKSMNLFMPIFSIVMVFTLPIALGIYWIMGAVIRSIQQFFLNRHFDKIDFDSIIEKNREKALKKKEKREGYTQRAISENGRMKTRTIQTNDVNEEALRNADAMKLNAKPGSMASKANLVRDYNNRNSDK